MVDRREESETDDKDQQGIPIKQLGGHSVLGATGSKTKAEQC